MTSTFTVSEIRKALNKHNKDLDNDIKIKIKDNKIEFSSAKAEEYKKMALQNMLIRDKKEEPKKKVMRKKKEPELLKGQQKLK